MATSLKKIHIIINPISGSDFPILPHLVRVLNKQKINWEISITKSHADSALFAKIAVEKKVDAVAMYGGDGTVMEVASVLSDTKIPLIIIPGGTANVMAKELGIPIDTLQALKVFTKKTPTKRVIDMGLCNRKPFVLRINVGFFADVVTNTSRSSKNALGQMSYILSGLESMRQSKLSVYSMILDGKHVELEGIGLIVANSGNIGITGLSLASGIKIDDGLLDVMVIQSADIPTIASLLKGVVQQKKPKSLVRYKVKQARISINPKQTVVQDDMPIEATHLDISVIPQTLTILQ